MAERNRTYAQFTTDWYDYRDEKLRTMHTHIPSNFTIAQTMTFTNTAEFLQTTFYLELRYSITRQGNNIHPRDTWSVTCPLCDPACHLQRRNQSHDGHLSHALNQLRRCPTRKHNHDKLTHAHGHLRKNDNMLNAQDLYTHIRLYPDKCFLHAALELILDALYPALQAKMAK